VKALIWNIRQGGGPRRERIARCIHGQAPDIVALVEFVPGNAGSFVESLRKSGLEHRICTERKGSDYAIGIFSRTPIAAARPSEIPILDDSGLWLEVSIPAHNFGLGVVHVPTNSRTRMKAFLSALIQVAARNAGGPFLFAGDFNTGIGPADGPMINFGDVDRFAALQDSGFTDVWRHIHGQRTEHTWSRNGKSYRIDHALASPGLLSRIRECHYLHDERIEGTSDHSALLVEINTANASPTSL